MATTIQHVASDMSSTPANGQPWNFHALLECYLLPRTIAADRKLPPGARLLWGVIRQHSFNDGRCTRSDETLGLLLGVGDRQLRRYCEALQSAGLLRTTPRPGKTPIRELLWDARFAGKIPVRVDTNVRGSGQIRPGVRTHPSGPYKEEGSSSASLQVKSAGDFKSSSPKDPALCANKPTAEWTEEDYIRRGRACGFPEYVVQRDIEHLRARRARGEDERMKQANEVISALPAAIPR